MVAWDEKTANAEFVPESITRSTSIASDDSDSRAESSGAIWETPPYPEPVFPAATLGPPCPLQAWDTDRFIRSNRAFPSLNDLKNVECYEDSITAAVVAVKRFPGKASSEDFPERCTGDLCLELRIGLWLSHLGHMSHQFAYKCYGVFMDSNGESLLAMEFLRGGDLFDYVASLGTPGPDREAVIMPTVKSLFAAVSALHDLGLAHGGISLESFMFRGAPGNSELVLIHFGRAVVGRLATAESGLRGKLSYRSPEMFKCSRYDSFAADLFALGVVLYTLAIGRYPWMSTEPGKCRCYDYVQSHGLRSFMQKRVVPQTQNRTVVDCMSEDLQRLVRTLLCDEPRRRFEALALLQSFV